MQYSHVPQIGRKESSLSQISGRQYKPTCEPIVLRAGTLDYARAINIACNRGRERGREKVRRAGWLVGWLSAVKFSSVAEFPAGPELSEAANSPTVVNLSEAALIYRCPLSPSALAIYRLLKVGTRKSFLSMREQNTIMFHWATPRPADVLNADCDRERRIRCLETFSRRLR